MLFLEAAALLHAKPGRAAEPLLFKFLLFLTFGPLEPTQDVALHPLASAGWVGIFITGLNLIPIGQLDGGHVLYALLLRRAHAVAVFLLLAAIVAVIAFGYWGWLLLLALLFVMGPRHPPRPSSKPPPGRSSMSTSGKTKENQQTVLAANVAQIMSELHRLAAANARSSATEAIQPRLGT